MTGVLDGVNPFIGWPTDGLISVGCSCCTVVGLFGVSMCRVSVDATSHVSGGLVVGFSWPILIGDC